MRIGFSSLIETASRWWRNGTEAVSRSMEHLSTGLRVSRAIDDAAGLAISEGLTARINGFEQGARNAQDGISLTQVAEGGLSEMHDTLQRMRTLAVSAANGTWSDEDRAAMETEFEQLMTGIDDVVARTEFNGASLLDGSVAARHIQVGSEAGDVVDLDIARFDTVGLGLRDDPTNISVTAFAAPATTSTATTTPTITGNPNSPGYKKKAAAAAAAAASTTTSTTTSTSTTSTTTTTTSTASTASTSSTSSPTTMPSSSSGAWSVSVGDQASATEAIGVIDDAIWSVSHGRADIGAVQNRLERSMTMSSRMSEDLTAARSRIRDADVAHEMAGLVRHQILGQAAAAMTSQAQSSMRRSMESLLL